MDNYNILDLREGHKTLLTKYIQFFKVKKEKIVRDIKLDFEDYQSQK